MTQLSTLLCDEIRRQLAGSKIARIPAGGELLWKWFMDLSKSRTYHMAGPNPLTFAEIDAYARVSRWQIEPRHMAILKAMDAVVIDHAHRPERQSPDGVKALPPISKAKMTVGMFDAMFGS